MVQEQPGRVERRLSAILAADVAGYSLLMHNDEDATHARLTMLLTDAVEPSIAQHGGRVVKNTGDGQNFEARSRRCGLQRNSRNASVSSRLAILMTCVSPFA